MRSYEEARAAWPRRFDLPLEEVLHVWIAHVEGHVSEHSKDPGGLTVYGLASRTHPWVTRDTTWAEAWARGYTPTYVDALRLRELPPWLAFALFEVVVQHSIGVEMFQRAVGAEVTGVIDDQTVAAAWARKGPASLVALTTERIRYVAGLGELWPSFSRGWMLRYCDALEVAFVLGSFAEPGTFSR